ncbi:MAG: peptidylprolyl isomerase [Candidatus Puniceispirillaceae bacterium]
MIYRQFMQTLISGLILISAFIQPSFAAIEIVAKVNGQPITNYDLAQRVNFLAAVTNIKLNESNRQRIETDALQMLIDEKLKLAAAQEIDPNISSRSLAMARDLIDSSFQQNDKNGFEVLRELKLDTASIQQKFVTDLAWASFIQAKFSNKLGDVDAKIDAEFARMLENATKPQIRVSELVLIPEPSRPLQDTLRLANEIVSAVTQGANFNAIAQQYSVAGSAQNGGRLGWLSTSQLPQNISDALAKIDVGAVTPPIQQDGVILLFQKNGERKNGQADPSQDRIWLTRALLPLAAAAANADRLEAAARLERDTAGISNCPDLLKLHDSYGSRMQGRLDNIIVGSLAPQMLTLVNELQPGVASAPLSFSEGIAVFMLCKREKAKIDLPSRADVERAIVEKLFGSLGERYLLRLRRAALIERR